ncbi:MAG TPA: glycosyltransferase family 4 protein [Candidatus Acidoferrum sp.]|nr:glycosyltransferase family 4 protein [Candidatus Acidoferrum sp.]
MPVETDQSRSKPAEPLHLKTSAANRDISLSLLTGGSDKPYVFGLATELSSKGVVQDLIASDELDSPEFRNIPRLRFLKLRGDQNPHVSLFRKTVRILSYYAKLIRYAATAKPKIFHILWNNKFLHFDRTLLTYYYKLLGKRIVLTVHNVNTEKRDNKDSALNRLTLRIQYRLANHLFVHTEKMKQEMIEGFGVHAERISVIPLGINNFAPQTNLTPDEAKRRLGIRNDEKAILFFGRITPYKGLEILVEAFQKSLPSAGSYRLMIAGRPEEATEATYWFPIREALQEDVQKGRVLFRAAHIPDEETELYFKAADVVVLPYRDIYQSGILFLGYSFGLPAIAANVGSLKDEMIEGRTGFLFKPGDPVDLAKAIEGYFASDLYEDLSRRRQEIQDYARQRHDWNIVGQATLGVYDQLLKD